MRHAFLFMVLCGCASAGTSEEAARQPAIFESKETGTLMGERPTSVVGTFAASPQAVLLAVRAVYEKFEIPITVNNPTTHQIGNPSFYKTRQMAGFPMTKLVNCGSGITGQNAASYRIYMSFLTDVLPDGQGGTKVNSLLVPFGQDMTGNASDRIPCVSIGKLEKAFLDRLHELVGK